MSDRGIESNVDWIKEKKEKLKKKDIISVLYLVSVADLCGLICDAYGL